MNITSLTRWSATAPVWQLVTAGVAVLVALGAAAWFATRVRRFVNKHDPADLITAAVALGATAYAGTGTWKYLGEAMHYSLDLKVFLVAVLEGAQVAEALRARKNIKESGTAGVDGVGLWVLTGISAALSTSVAGNVREALGRAVVPMVGAWLWERALAPQRRAAKARRTSGPVRWRITPERIFVWLRLADAIDTDVMRVDSARRVAKFLRVTDRERDGWRFPLTAKARAYRGRMKLIGDALRHGDPAEVHTKLSQAAFADALSRLGIGPEQAAETLPDGESLSRDVKADITTQAEAQNGPVLNILPPFTRPFPPQANPFSAPVNTLPSEPSVNPVEQARELQRQGLSYQQIGNRLGMSKTWAFNAVNAQDLTAVNGHAG